MWRHLDQGNIPRHVGVELGKALLALDPLPDLEHAFMRLCQTMCM
jgi:hypothetical protein